MNVERNQADLNLRSVYASSVAAMTAMFFFGVGVPCWYAFDLGWGLGLGAMAAFWGGPGFGVMAAGARIALHEDQRAHQAVAPVAAVENRVNRRLLALG